MVEKCPRKSWRKNDSLFWSRTPAHTHRTPKEAKGRWPTTRDPFSLFVSLCAAPAQFGAVRSSTLDPSDEPKEGRHLGEVETTPPSTAFVPKAKCGQRYQGQRCARRKCESAIATVSEKGLASDRLPICAHMLCYERARTHTPRLRARAHTRTDTQPLLFFSSCSMADTYAFAAPLGLLLSPPPHRSTHARTHPISHGHVRVRFTPPPYSSFHCRTRHYPSLWRQEVKKSAKKHNLYHRSCMISIAG